MTFRSLQAPFRLLAAASVFSLVLASHATLARAQANQASDGDKKFLDETAQDSNYEIKTGQLALQKSGSADVKAYATMLIHDHTSLLQETARADKAAGVSPQGTSTMSVSDRASYAKLDLLSGKTFEDSYIKGLLDGNDEAIREAQAEISSSTVPAVKQLATHRLALDKKHAAGAKQLATAHHVNP